MSDDHDHSHASASAGMRAGARYRQRLKWALVLIASLCAVEFVAGFLTRSLALLSDAGHMLTDVAGLAMALAAIHAANAPTTNRQRSFGLYRLEILAALANAMLLLGIAAYVLYEAVERFREPVRVLGVPMLIVGVAGLAANVGAFLLLRSGSKESINVEGAYLEVVSDTLGSICVIAAAAVPALTGWPYVDPIVGAGIGLFIVPRTLKLARQAVRILIQEAPPHVDVADLERALAALPGVAEVHDLHVWTLTSEMEVLSAHLRAKADAETGPLLVAAQAMLEERFGIHHATLQVEPTSHQGCEKLTW